MLSCLLLWLFTAPVEEVIHPQPIAQWQVPFVPSMALVTSDGTSWLLDDQGAMGYTYDVSGQLKESFNLPEAVNSAFVAPKDAVLVHYGGNLLARLTKTGSMRWQLEIPPPSMPPQVFNDLLVYTVGRNIQLIDPEDGSARYSLSNSKNVVSVQIADGWIWITDVDGNTLTWEPVTEEKQERLVGREELLHFVERSPAGDLALISDDGHLEAQRADGKRLWRRHFHIDITTPPIYLQGPKKLQLLVATKGRNLFVFGASKGEQKARRLLNGRPRSLVPLNDHVALLTADQVPSLLWYSALTGAFSPQKIETKIDVTADCVSFLLLVAENGIIRLYRK